MLTIEMLKKFGADTEDGLKRCMNNEAFYLRLVNMGLADRNFDRLAAAVEAGRAGEAFEAAHALKGVMGNLSLTPLYEPLSKLTEALRGKDEMVDVSSELKQILALLDKVRSLTE